MPALHTGGCLCGAVRYAIDGEPLTVYVCHCSDCQRRTGSAFAISAIFERGAISVVAGTPASYRALLPDGRVKAGRHCAACATRLWGEPVKAPQIAVVQPGTLDDPGWLTPVGHQWTRSALPWALPNDGRPRFETQPDDPRELWRLFRQRRRPA